MISTMIEKFILEFRFIISRAKKRNLLDMFCDVRKHDIWFCRRQVSATVLVD